MDNNMVLNTGFNELVFENRHKGYGAYQIRKRYTRNVFIAGLISVSVFASGMFLYFASMPNAMAADAPKDNGSFRIVTIDDPHIITPPKPKQPDPIVKPATPPAGPKTPVVNQDLTNPPKVSDDHKTPPTNYDAGGSPNGDPHSLANNNDTTKHNEVHCDTCGLPKPPQRVTWTMDKIDMPDLDKFFAKNIKYPEMAKEQNIQGTVILEFVVGVDGSVKELKIAKGVHPLLDNEVMRVAPGMPKWKPVTFNGVPVEYIFHKPIHFILGN